MVKLNTRRRRDVCWKSCRRTKFCRFSIFGIFADHKFAKQKVSTLQLHSDEKGSQSERDATQKVKSDADERDRSTSVYAWLWFSIHEVKRGGFGGEKGWNWIDGRVHCGTWNDQLDVDADDVIFVELVALVIFVLISQCVRIFVGTTFRLFVPTSRRWVPSDVRAADCMLTSAFWCLISYQT